MPSSGPSAQEELDRLEPELEEPGDAALGAVGEVGVAGVAGDALLLRPAQQLVDRAAEQLALQVPERVVDRADRVAGQARRCRTAPRCAASRPSSFSVAMASCPTSSCAKWPLMISLDRAAVVGDAEPPGAVLGGDHQAARLQWACQSARRYSG